MYLQMKILCLLRLFGGGDFSIYRSYYDRLYPDYLQFIACKLDLKYLNIFGDALGIIFFVAKNFSQFSGSG